ncbi:hypothetical protein QBC36DRAFT_27329 [Triangularia setosa]|uniref:CorA-like transporter domain-containing protein n=1 Tax=Triangularia setosa TaxID=2587417 RepID=A0AAN6W812_9PEZI|nr:hypothetical protein QBC36DRAFT_27329 [Podospora setosa]
MTIFAMSIRPWVATGSRRIQANRINEVRNALAPNAHQTFTDDLPGEVEVQFAAVDKTGVKATPMLRSGEDITAYLDMQQEGEEGEAAEDKGKTSCRYIFLHPAIGRSPLLIPHQQMLQLLQRWNVFPEICRYLTAFGSKHFNRDEAFAGFDCVEHVESDRQTINILGKGS